MEQKVMLITGASGAMGLEISAWFASLGYTLALHWNNTPIAIAENENRKHFQADLTKESEAQELIEKVIAAFGKIDYVINNAGVSYSSMSWKTDASIWRKTMAVNLDAPFYVCKALIPFMRERSFGRIINISSVVAQTGFPGTSAYAASKAGLIGFTKTLAKELANKKITANVLALGYFNVGIIEDVPEDMQQQIISDIPCNRLGNPETVCKAIEFLISKEAAYVTGQTINLNGGLYS